MSGTWEFDISAAPKGGFTEGMVLKGPKGKERLVQTYHAPVLIVATKCGKVTTTKWLHEEGRWQMLAAGEDFIAWQPWPTHPNFLGPHSQEVDDGQPHPSSNAGGAKCDGAQTIVGRADGRSGLSITQLEQQDASVSQDRNEPISDSEATVTHSNTTLATSPEASRKAGEGALLPLSPAANPDDDVPDFLKRDIAPARKTAADFRPNCLRPDACASSGLHHCYQCEKASETMEGAAA